VKLGLCIVLQTIAFDNVADKTSRQMGVRDARCAEYSKPEELCMNIYSMQFKKKKKKKAHKHE